MIARRYTVPDIKRDQQTGEITFLGKFYDSEEDAQAAREEYENGLDDKADMELKERHENLD